MKLLLSILTLVYLVYAQDAGSPRSHTGCGMLVGKIHCYGGFLFTSVTDKKPDNSLIELDLTNNSGSNADQLSQEWKIVNADTTLIDNSIRLYPQVIALPDGYRMLINGGYTPNASEPLTYQTIVYSAQQNKFFSRLSYTESPYGSRQIYHSSVVNIPGKGVAFYGGYEQFINTSWATPSTNVSAFNFANNTQRFIGFVEVAFFNLDLTTQDRWTVPVPFTYRQDFFYAKQASVFDISNNIILYLGGEKRSNNPVSYSNNPVGGVFDIATTFNTSSSTWGTINLTGDIPASGRTYFTLTLLPQTNRHVLLYGGQSGGTANGDYCYVLNLDTRSWSRRIIDAPDGTALVRSQHSAVLVNYNTLFILWGIDVNKNGINSIIMLNVSTPAKDISLLTKYIDPNAPNSGEMVNYEPHSSGLNSGAKAGIAVACIVVAILSISVIWICIRNKKIDKQRKLAEQRLEEERYVEPVEVDWDKIEDKYIELPQTTFGNQQNINSSTSGTAVDYNDDELQHHNISTPLVHPDGINIDRPHTYENTGSSYIQKPDIVH